MEPIKDIWNEFKDRINNPLFGSFIISWLIWNWRIPLVLVFYKHEQLIATKTTYMDVIQRYAGIGSMFIFPFATACAYVIMAPYAKRAVTLYLAGRERETDEKLYKQSETITVPVDQAMESRTRINEMKRNLAELIRNESAIKNENASLLIKENELTQKIEEITTTNSNRVLEIITENNNTIIDLNTAHDKTIQDMNAAFEARSEQHRKDSAENLRKLQEINDGLVQSITQERIQSSQERKDFIARQGLDKIALENKDNELQNKLAYLDQVEKHRNALVETSENDQYVIGALKADLDKSKQNLINTKETYEKTILAIEKRQEIQLSENTQIFNTTNSKFMDLRSEYANMEAKYSKEIDQLNERILELTQENYGLRYPGQ